MFIRTPKTFYSHSQARSYTVRAGGIQEAAQRRLSSNPPCSGSYRPPSGANIADNLGGDLVSSSDLISWWTDIISYRTDLISYRTDFSYPISLWIEFWLKLCQEMWIIRTTVSCGFVSCILYLRPIKDQRCKKFTFPGGNNDQNSNDTFEWWTIATRTAFRCHPQC